MVRLLSVKSRDYQKLLALRNKVLRKPLGMDINNDDLSDESECLHLAYYPNADEIVACLKIKPLEQNIYQIQQMAVEPAYQKRGIGAELLKEAESIIIGKGGKKIMIEARDSVKEFYIRCGYRPVGGLYNKINLPHQKMIKLV